MKKWLGIGLLLILIASRFYNLETSARFVWDESSDLVRMQELFKHPKLTLIGPISEDRVKIFGSLSYYLTMPFVILGKFEPVSAVWATAFFGILTVIIFSLLTYKTKNRWWLAAILGIISYPLLQSSRWAWNPHFIPWWEIMAIGAVIFFKDWKGALLAGLLMGLTGHNHYYAWFAAAGMGVMILMENWKNIKRWGSYGVGLVLAISPFAIFDLTHPPGLFLSRMIFFSPLSSEKGGFNLENMGNNLVNIPLQMGTYLGGNNKIVGIILVILIVGTVMIWRKNQENKWLIPVIFQIGGLSVIGGGVFEHYLLPAVIFIYWWLVRSWDKNWGSKIILGVILISNIIYLPKVIWQNDWSTNIGATKEIVSIIENNKMDSEFNLVVVGSPDPNTKGRRYRDLLELKGIKTEPIENYSQIDQLYVITYQNWDKVRNDPSYELNEFRNKQASKEWKIINSEWKVYLVE